MGSRMPNSGLRPSWRRRPRAQVAALPGLDHQLPAALAGRLRAASRRRDPCRSDDHNSGPLIRIRRNDRLAMMSVTSLKIPTSGTLATPTSSRRPTLPGGERRKGRFRPGWILLPGWPGVEIREYHTTKPVEFKPHALPTRRPRRSGSALERRRLGMPSETVGLASCADPRARRYKIRRTAIRPGRRAGSP